MYILNPYDDALKFILENGERRVNRTGVDSLSVFSLTATYTIDEYFPLLPKRKLYPKSVFAELLWMLSGSTNNDDLVKLGCNFWTPWVDLENPENRAFYERTKLKPPLLGPVYGFQLRHFGGQYGNGLGGNLYELNTETCDLEVSHKDYVVSYESPSPRKMNIYGMGGFDQIKWLVNEIKANPHSRRLVVSMWNPKDRYLMRLEPCHYAFHVDIDNEGRMSLLLNQRSCDFPIGAPANIQFYSALCYMLAQQTGYKPYKFIHRAEDAHIYVNQLEEVKKYLDRSEMNSPKLILHKADDIFSYKVEDFEIVDYKPHPAIKIPVTV
jgi:thymidylate synthase